MKIKTLLLLPLMLCASQLMAWDTDAYCCDDYNSCNSCFCGVYFIYENVIVKPYFSRNSAYFLDEPGDVEGQKGVMFDWDYEYSPRFELGWVNDCGIGIRGRYWRFHNDLTLHASNDDGDIAVGFGGDGVSGLAITQAKRAKFRHRLELDVVDFELTFAWCNWIYSAGGRYVCLDQRYNAVDLDNIEPPFFAKHDFDGGGITTAVEYIRPVWCGFSLFTKARGSLLYGDSKFLAASSDGDSAIRNKNETDILAVGELQLGVDWRTSICNYCTFFRFAIETQYWLGGGSAGPGNNAIYDEANYQNTNPQDDNLGFFGFNLAIGVMF